MSILLGLVITAMAMDAASANNGEKLTPVEYLSELPECLIFHQQAWGELGINTAAYASGKTPPKLRINDKEYSKGLGHHAPGEIIIELDGRYERFEAEVGVQWQGGGVGSVVFQVFVDGEKRFDSGTMRERDSAMPVSVALSGAQELRLVTTDAGDGITCDCANWAEARLVRSADPQIAKLQEPFDIAPFARVVTWDPSRMDGARAGRTEEFHAEDLFLETDVLPNPNGSYTVPIAQDGRGCIGLQWLERRRVRELGIEFADGTHRRPTEGVQVQCWVGESGWQGKWVPLVGKIERQDKLWTCRVDYRQNPEVRMGTRKVRWVFPKAADAPIVSQIWAHTLSRYDTARIRIELEKPLSGETGEIELYNGTIETPSGACLRANWDLGERCSITVRYCRPGLNKSDRTVLRIKLPIGSLAVAVEDVLANPCVYVRDPGIFLLQEPVQTRPYDYLASTARKETIVDRVRKMPDQTLEQALARTRNPIQDTGPMLLSLACDNRKFLVEREGAIHFTAQPDDAARMFMQPLKYGCRLVPTFGSGQAKFARRYLDGGWLPVPVTEFLDGTVTYTQRTCVAPSDKQDHPDSHEWLARKPACVVEFSIHNTGPKPADVQLKLTFLADAETSRPAEVKPVSQGAVVQADGRLLAFVSTSGSANLQVREEGGCIVLEGKLQGRRSASCSVCLPGWSMAPEEYPQLSAPERLLARVGAYWTRILSSAVQFEIPDPFLANVIRASQVHCLIAARNEERRARLAPWIASMTYGPLESEANSIIRGMMLMGHTDFARRCLEFFISRYSEAGYLTTGYTLMGTGWHLQTLGEYFALTHDREWMKQFAPEVDRVCRWIVRQREKTRRSDARGEKVPEYGLMPPGVLADWNAFAYYFSLNGYYYAGLAGAGAALAEIEHPDAGSLLANAEDFRKEILRAYEWTQSRTPVVPLRNGTWVLGYPSQVHVLGPTNHFFPGEDANRSWAYDVELGAHQMVPQGIIEPNSPETLRMINHMEDVHFLSDGWFDYPAEKSEKDWFNLGGFAKVQPYYCRIAEIYALRDDVKPFIRSYFNALASLLNTEVLSFWEHFHASGAWNKTHETGYFLQQTRFMLVMEYGDELRLAPLVTSSWMKDGMTVSVRNAPTRFGEVSYRITSHVKDGYIEAEIEPPTRSAPTEILIRLRHPWGKHIRSVTVNGKPHTGFDPPGDCVHIKPGKSTIRLRAEY